MGPRQLFTVQRKEALRHWRARGYYDLLVLYKAHHTWETRHTHTWQVRQDTSSGQCEWLCVRETQLPCSRPEVKTPLLIVILTICKTAVVRIIAANTAVVVQKRLGGPVATPSMTLSSTAEQWWAPSIAGWRGGGREGG